MLRRTTDRKLESFKIFPYVAWGLVILFLLFAFKLITELNDTADSLDKNADSLERKVNVKNRDLKNLNFEE